MPATGNGAVGAAMVLLMALVAAGCGGHGRAGPASARGLAALMRSRSTTPTTIAIRLDWPVVAPVTSPFGLRDGRPHEGVDFRVPTGTPVRAAGDGEVIYAGDGLRGYGRLLVVEHAPRLVTVYAHNSRLLVGEGARVARGQVVARSGATGRVTAPHLHFELRVDGVPRDPLPYLGRPAPRVAAAEMVGAPTIAAIDAR